MGYILFFITVITINFVFSKQSSCVGLIRIQPNKEEKKTNQNQSSKEEINTLREIENDDMEVIHEKLLPLNEDSDKDSQEGIKDAFSQDNGDKFQSIKQNN